MTSWGKSPVQYIGHTKELLESPAWSQLSFAARKVLDRLEVEHLRHNGAKNGKLIVTYDDFVAWGLRRGSIREAIEIVVALGFVEITRRGFKTVPSLYRLTYVLSAGNRTPVTNDWLKHDAASIRRSIRLVKANLDAEKEERRRKRNEKISPRGAHISRRAGTVVNLRRQ